MALTLVVLLFLLIAVVPGPLGLAIALLLLLPLLLSTPVTLAATLLLLLPVGAALLAALLLLLTLVPPTASSSVALTLLVSTFQICKTLLKLLQNRRLLLFLRNPSRLFTSRFYRFTKLRAR